jgi:phosphate:Na+ symporter
MKTINIKAILYSFFLLSVAYLLFLSSDAKIIIAGVAIFLVGMIFMEDGFKSFSGGVLEKVLKSTTSSFPKAIFSGFLSTSIVQSSSLISIIVISFLSAELISLSGAIGVIFGSNIGTTTTAWIVSTFGIKIKIAKLAMPMLIFGSIFLFNKNKTLKGLGNILLGLGFVFLGISFMKDGFEALKSGLDLASFAMQGYFGVFIYVLIGASATVIIQSSSATMALIITALATGQILYFNALSLAIGANIGTTITAILGSLASNSDGKRLAVAHFIFNIITAFVAVLFIYQLSDLVQYLSSFIGIKSHDYAMQLALFHTIFNVLGVILLLPFVSKLVNFLQTLFTKDSQELSHARYLDDTIINVPEVAILALQKEIIHLYDNATEALSHALSLHRHTYIGMNEDISKIVKSSVKQIDINLDDFYQKKIKSLYGEIINYATLSQEDMSPEDKNRVYELKIACRDIVDTLKIVKELQKNINRFIKSKNPHIRDEYNFLREQIARVLDEIHTIRENDNEIDMIDRLKTLEKNLDKLDMLANGRIDSLIRNSKIDTKMATSLINDSLIAYEISKKLINIATLLWTKDTNS